MVPFFVTSYWVEGEVAIVNSLQNLNGLSVFVLFYLAVAASMIGYSLWSYLLTNYPAGQVAPLTLGVPIVGIMSASLLLNEQMSAQQIFGIVIVMLGLLVNTFGSKLYRRFRLKSVR